MDLFNKSSLTTEQLAEIRKLHFSTRHLVNIGIAGDYRSAFRGRGIEFEEVREYVPGDDVRAIDWKVTARMNSPFVKSYREERELTVMIAVDVSASTRTGTRARLRETLIAQIGAVLSLIALNNNDKVGLLTFSDRLETYHPPRKGRNAVWRILKEVLTPAAYSEQTDLNALFVFLHNVLKRRSIIFVLSDFFSSRYELSLATLAKRHDVTVIAARDPADEAMPSVGLLRVVDPESKQAYLLDLHSADARRTYARLSREVRDDFKTMLARNRVGLIEVKTDTPFMPEIRRYFEMRHAKL